MSSKRKYKFTLEDVLLLLDINRESDEKVVVSEHCEEDTWVVLPMNSKLLWVRENLDRKVESIGVYDGMLQIWLTEEKKLEG